MRTLEPSIENGSTDRVVFGVGAEARTADLLRELGAQRVLLVAQARHTGGADRIATALGDRCVGRFVTDVPQVPGHVADAAVEQARASGADWVVAHGGGTPIGVAKAVALALDVEVGAVPTTYAGSERTDIWGLTRDGVKTTGRDPRVRPSLVVYDPALMRDLPVELSLESLFNALAHSLEALYDASAPDWARQAAEDSLVPLIDGIQGIHARPTDLHARETALYGAWLASTALGAAQMALHHKLAHVLGGSFDTPHAATHSALVSYTFGFDAPFAPDALARVRRAWRTDDPPAFLYDLQRSLGLNTSLRKVGVPDEAVSDIATHVLAKRYSNPRPYDRADLEALLQDALHDRRPSLFSCREPLPAGSGPHASLPFTVRGAPLAFARAVVLAVHGRGASADRFLADLERSLGPRPGVAYVAPQASGNTWYPKGFRAPVSENQPGLDSALSVVQGLWDHLAAIVGPERIVPVGFSQGACLVLTWLSRTSARPKRVLAFTGAHTPLDGAGFAAAHGCDVHVSRAAEDPWVTAEQLEETVATLRSAGAHVSHPTVPGGTHRIHPPDHQALARAVESAMIDDDLEYQSGFGNALSSEARPGALPRTQNSPRKVPYGLFTEQINGTGFTVHRAENRRTWMYRLRPQILDRGFRPRPSGRFVGTFEEGVPSPEVMRFRPLTAPTAPTDFLAGLTTFAGAGNAAFRKGAAVHLYSANADMVDTAFCNIDGDLLLVPEDGRLHIRTELGRLNVAPGEIVILPRGIRFQVLLRDGRARGFVAELYDGHFQLPERGPVGANGLADERHFQAPVADFEDDVRPWTVVVRQGGKLWEIDSPHSPFDVVAWHGNYAPFKYDLDRFNSFGSVSFDHGDPSILTVLTSPMDTRGRNAIDVAVFRGRWDVAEHTFRPPFFHRNSAVEFNGVVKSDARKGPWQPGAFTYTPYLSPHGVSTGNYEHTVTAPDATVERPVRLPEESVWIQFESTYLMAVMPWMFDHDDRDRDYLKSFGTYAPAADAT
ncbi:MAG: iron-containing alcohol dehydrogenase [Myxococcota bacterium]